MITLFMQHMRRGYAIWPVLEGVGAGVVVIGAQSERETTAESGYHAQLPATHQSVGGPVHIGAELPAAAKWQVIDDIAGEDTFHVVVASSVLSRGIVCVLPPGTGRRGLSAFSPESLGVRHAA